VFVHELSPIAGAMGLTVNELIDLSQCRRRIESAVEA